MHAASDPVVSIFPHGSSDFASPDELRAFLRNELPTERQGLYRLRQLKNTRRFAGRRFVDAIVPDSIVLFKMCGSIWGAAEVKEGISKLDQPEGPYHYEVRFHTDKIKVCDNGVPVDCIIEEAATGAVPDTGVAKRWYRVLGNKDTVLPKIQPLLGLPPGW